MQIGDAKFVSRTYSMRPRKEKGEETRPSGEAATTRAVGGREHSASRSCARSRCTPRAQMMRRRPRRRRTAAGEPNRSLLL